MTTQSPSAMRALQATFTEARGSRQAAEALAPLLALLDPAQPGEGSPLAEVTELLQTILHTQHLTLQAIEALAIRPDQGQRQR